MFIILLSFVARAIIAFLLLILLFLALHMKYNRKDDITIVERLGRFSRMYDEPTFFFLIPFIDRIYEKISNGEIVEARRFSYMLHSEEHHVNLTIRYRVFDPKLYAYTSIDPIASIIDLLKTGLEHEMDKQDIDMQVGSYGRDLGMTIINYHFN